MMDLPDLSNTKATGLLTRALALKAATRFVLDSHPIPAVLPESGRPFVLDITSREWHVVFQEEPNTYLALTAGALQPRYRRVAVHAETGACRWVDGS